MSLSPRGDLHTDICNCAVPGPPGAALLLSGLINPRHRSCCRFGCAEPGYPPDMTDDRTDQRAADLLPEERSAGGSADPQAQAEAILAESDEREADLEAAPSSFHENRTVEQTVTPGESTR